MNIQPEKARTEITAEVEAQQDYVNQLKKEIFRTDKTNRSKYIQDFIQEFSRYTSISCMDDIIIASLVSDIIYIGDYHAVPQYQQCAVRLIKEIISRNSSIVLATEIFFGHNQRLLDKYLENSISESDFLKRVRYHQEWGMPWEWYSPIFELARKYHLPVYAVDCAPRNQLRYISRRDNYAAEKIFDIVTDHPDSKVIVIHGESHLAKNHLPGKVEKIFSENKIPARKKLILVQNIDRIYWQLAVNGVPHEDAVKLDDEKYCIVNITPIVKYEHYLQLLDRWKQVYPDDDDIDLSPTVYHMIDTILNFLKIDKFSFEIQDASNESWLLIDIFPEVFSYENFESFVSILRSNKLDESHIEEIILHAQRHGSSYIPKLNCIFIGEFHVNDGGEEAAHFVHFASRGQIYESYTVSGSKSDLFYQHVLEEAIGYFGAKIINPKRNHFRDGIFFKYYRKSKEIIEKETDYIYEDFMEIVEFIIVHKKFELNYQEMEEIPPLLYRGISSTGEKYVTLIHELGYFLGEQLYDGFHKGKISIRKIRSLFGKNFSEPMESLEIYLDLAAKLNRPESFIKAKPKSRTKSTRGRKKK